MKIDDQLSKEKNKKSKKATKSNKLVYSLLLIISIVVLIVALFAPISNKTISVVSGIGCSGIASVIVAWLIEITNSKHRDDLNKDLLNRLFFDHDNALKKELSKIVRLMAKYDPEIEINKSFNVKEVKALLESRDTLKPFLGVLRSCYSVLGEECKLIDEGLLLSCDFSPKNIEVYSLIQSCKRNFLTFKGLEEELSDPDESVILIATLLLKVHLALVSQIIEIRGNFFEIQLSAEDVEHIETFRKAKESNESKDRIGE